MLPAALRAGLYGLASLAFGCSHLSGVTVGPIATRPSDVDMSYGDELRLRQGAGSAEGDALLVVEAQARLAVAERASAISAGVGPAYLRWFGSGALTARVAPMFGAQYFDRSVFASAGLHGSLGVGLSLDETEQAVPSWGRIWAMGLPANGREMVAHSRERTLLTLELTGSADAHVRGVTLSAGILLGLAWSEERLTRERSVPTFLLRP